MREKVFIFDVTATIWACLHHFPLPFTSYAGEVDGLGACLSLQWVLLQNRKTWVWGIYHFYNEGQVKLFFVSERGLYPSRVLLQMEPWEIVWMQSSEGLSFLVYSARIHKDAQGPWWIDSLNNYIADFNKLIKNIKKLSPRRK